MRVTKNDNNGHYNFLDRLLRGREKAHSVEELRKDYQLVVLIGLAMIGSLFVYAGLVEFLKQDPSQTGFLPSSEAAILKYALFGIAAIQFLMVRFIRNRVLSKGDVAEKPSPPKRGFSPQVSKLIRAAVMTYALCESIALYGLVLFFLTKDALDFYCFMGLSLVYFAIHFPKYRQWEDWIRTRNGNFGQLRQDGF